VWPCFTELPFLGLESSKMRPTWRLSQVFFSTGAELEQSVVF
jgi:hypothetical protein